MKVVHEFSPTMLTPKSVIMHMIVDRNIFYLADSTQGAILVFDSHSKQTKIVTANGLTQPQNHPLTLANSQKMHLRLGVTGLALQNSAKVIF